MTYNDLPQEVKDLIQEYKDLNYDHNDLSRRMGTYGERGLYPSLKSCRSKMRKTNEKLKKHNIMCRPNPNNHYEVKLFIID